MDQSIHLKNLLDVLKISIQEKLEIVNTEDQAFVRLAAEWLGYEDLEDDHFVDGAGDRGVDFWYESDPGFDIMQVKSHQLGNSGEIQTESFDKTGVLDLGRVKTYMLDDKVVDEKNKNLQHFRHQWESAITRRSMGMETEPFQVNLGLVLFGEGLTEPAHNEYEAFERSLKQPQEYRGVPIEFRTRLYTINNILLERWRQDNREWLDSLNHKRDYVDLFPRPQAEEKVWLYSHNSVIFYCRAIDLIKAYDSFGYQIFEPNVRAHVGKTKVNMLIKDSLIHRVTRHEFMYLNNGVTITCNNYKTPKENRNYFRVFQPGVINGLQTVVSLHEAYEALPAEEKKDLEQNCYVLLRLLGEKAVQDINRVVIASNTQNPMQARNLKSNTSEQIYYEKLFAKLGWFYARKQGAWDAFSKNPSHWRTLRDHKKSDFKVDGGGRGKYRWVDNEVIGQTWLSFIGFSNEAVHNKRFIFDNDDFYQLTFLNRTPRHGADYNFQISAAREGLISQAPSQAMLLVSYLARTLATKLALSSRDNREKACQRAGLDINSTPLEIIELDLAKDDEFLVEQVLSSVTFVFVEAFGYILYKARCLYNPRS